MTKKNNASFMKPMTVSSELSEVIGTGPMPRTQVTKKLWDYNYKTLDNNHTTLLNIIPFAFGGFYFTTIYFILKYFANLGSMIG